MHGGLYYQVWSHHKNWKLILELAEVKLKKDISMKHNHVFLILSNKTNLSMGEDTYIEWSEYWIITKMHSK